MFRENIISELKQKITLNPDCVDNYFNLANYYIGSDDLNNALNVYKEVLKIKPNDYQALINMGSICFYKKLYILILSINNNYE